MLTIGFTNRYFTLWDVVSAEKHGDGFKQLETTYTYFQNLSMVRGAAIAKVEEMYPGQKFVVDTNVCGQSSWVAYGPKVDTLEDFQFPFGRSRGADMRVSDDVYHLEIQAHEGKNEARKAFAVARLMELGEWVEFEGVKMNASRPAIIEAERIAEAAAAFRKDGHFGADGAKVKLSVTLISERDFETQYGRCYVQEFQTETGEIYNYTGSAPASKGTIEREWGTQKLYPEVGEKLNIAATIKHSKSYYNPEQPETKLLRIKIIN